MTSFSRKFCDFKVEVIVFMQKIIFFLILLFPTLTFGQSFTGNYRAIFFNMFSEPKTIIAEFEVKSDNSIIGKVKVGNETKQFNGAVDKKGKFEAVSVAEGNSVYQLKGKFDKENTISFIQRVQIGSGLNKSVSENSFEGSFEKVAIPVAQNIQPVGEAPFTVIDNGKSLLLFQHSNQYFGNQWTDFTGKVVFKDSANDKQMELTANVTIDQQKRSFRIFTKSILPNQKVWKTTDLQTASYREETGKPDARNSFLTASHIYAENKALQNGTLEIVKETEKQIVFKLVNFKIKRLVKTDFVEINGFIYADK